MTYFISSFRMLVVSFSCKATDKLLKGFLLSFLPNEPSLADDVSKLGR